MKALKNDYTKYVNEIRTAIESCYANKCEPSNTELMRLYTFIGGSICAQGEKAFVVHLAVMLGHQFPELKGFSPRNLRRMRDYYRTYEKCPDLKGETQTLGWTQNTVILECCENNEQRTFYIGLASEQNLSKLLLLKAIENGTIEQPIREIDTIQNIPTVSEPMSDNSANKSVDTAEPKKTACIAFVPMYGPLRQGSSLPCGRETANDKNGSVPDNHHIEKNPSSLNEYQKRKGSSFFIISIRSFGERLGPPWKDHYRRPPEIMFTLGESPPGWNKIAKTA